jgi:hypothetical protein
MKRAELLISERDEKLRQIARGFYGGMERTHATAGLHGRFGGHSSLGRCRMARLC